jgi:hypothetical protein
VTAPTPAELDQQLIDASRQLAALEQATPRDAEAIAAAKANVLAVRTQRYPSG